MPVSSWVFYSHRCRCSDETWPIWNKQTSVYAIIFILVLCGLPTLPVDTGVPVPSAYQSHQVRVTSFEHVKSPKGIKTIVAGDVSDSSWNAKTERQWDFFLLSLCKIMTAPLNRKQGWLAFHLLLGVNGRRRSKNCPGSDFLDGHRKSYLSCDFSRHIFFCSCKFCSGTFTVFINLSTIAPCLVALCGGLTLAGHQVLTKPLYHSPPQQGKRRKKIRW